MRKKADKKPQNPSALEPALEPSPEAEAAGDGGTGEVGRVIARAHELARLDEWDAACKTLRPLAEEVPGSVELWLQMARWEQSAGSVAEAEATLRHAIEINGARQHNRFLLWHALAQLLCEEQSWPLASQAAREGIALARLMASRPEAEAIEKLVSIGVWEGGELRADRLREHEMLEMLGTSYAHAGRFEEAGQAMRDLLALSPRDPLHRMRLGSLLQSHGALGEAAREFERVTEMAPGTFFAHDAESALEMLDKAQIQQILVRAGEQRAFGLRLERDMEATLDSHAFYLSENGRESLRQMIDDGRPDLARTPRIQ